MDRRREHLSRRHRRRVIDSVAVICRRSVIAIASIAVIVAMIMMVVMTPVILVMLEATCVVVMMRIVHLHRFQIFLFASKHFRSLTRGCLPGRLRRGVPDLLVDFPPTSSRTASGDRPGPSPGRPPGPPSKKDHFSIDGLNRIGCFSARSGPAPFWDLGRPGSARQGTYCKTPAPLTSATKHTVKPQCRCRS